MYSFCAARAYAAGGTVSARSAMALERAQVRNPHPLEVLPVSRDDDQISLKRCRRDQTIDGRNGVGRSQRPPPLRDGLVDTDDPITKLDGCPCEPASQHARRGRIPSPHPFHTPSQFTNGENAQEQLARSPSSQPSNHVGVRSPFAQFRHDVRVEEIAHSPTSRGGDGSRAKSASSPMSGMASRCSTNASGRDFPLPSEADRD